MPVMARVTCRAFCGEIRAYLYVERTVGADITWRGFLSRVV
jgi:hypothetical protein